MRMRTVPTLLALLAACHADAPTPEPAVDAAEPAPAAPTYAEQHQGDYVSVRLEADLSGFDEQDKRMIAALVRASEVMDGLFWLQSWGDPQPLLDGIDDPATRRLAELNFGPWDRLNGDVPFVEGVGERPLGARFYPEDMAKEEFEAADLPDKTSGYTLLRRDEQNALVTVPFHEAYQPQLEQAADLLREAAADSKDAQFRAYLEQRADALLSDDYRPSDMAWMDMKKNPVDIVIGPNESYEDQLFGYKNAYEGVVLLKDQAWSEKLARFASFLPDLQRGLPVPEEYKAEEPGSDADLNAYTVVYYGGNANVGAKTIAINLPNDEVVQLEKGTRRLQLENVMKAKFDQILMPIGELLIAEDQQDHLTFDAFFQTVMFHEVAHGLGIKNTLDGKGTVRDALKDHASAFEEGKADVLGLYLVTSLIDRGELPAETLEDNYVTFMAGILRSIRFGASDAHARANVVRFNFFAERGAFVRDEATGRYRVQVDKMRDAMNALSERLLTVQGDGDYAGAQQMMDTLGKIGPALQGDLDRLAEADIPIDVTFEQGVDVLGL
ncbi:MAG: Zn-dependent hydrolase [Myxococcota bacterium]